MSHGWRAVAEVVQTKLRHAGEGAPAAAELFEALCLLGSDPIPRELVSSLADEWLVGSDALLRYGLVELVASGAITVPVLLAETGRALTDAPGPRLIGVADALLRQLPAWPDEDSVAPGGRLLPHADAVVGRVEARSDASDAELRLAAQIARRLALARRVLSRWDACLDAASRESALLERCAEPPRMELDEAHVNLASMLRQSGDLAQAERLLRPVTTRLRATSGDDALVTVRARSSLGRLERDLGHLDRAVTELRAAIEAPDTGRNDRERAGVRVSLIDALQDRGDAPALEEATAIASEVFAILCAPAPFDPWPDGLLRELPVPAATALVALAAVRWLEGSPLSAATLLGRSERLLDRSLEHDDNRKIRGRLLSCRVQLDLGYQERAARDARAALRLSESVFPRGHLSGHQARVHLGAALGATPEAIEMLESAVAGLGGPGAIRSIHHAWARAHLALATARFDPAREDEAVEDIGECEAWIADARGAGHPHALRLAIGRASLLGPDTCKQLAAAHPVGEGLLHGRLLELSGDLTRALDRYTAACGPDAPCTRRIRARTGR